MDFNGLYKYLFFMPLASMTLFLASCSGKGTSAVSRMQAEAAPVQVFDSGGIRIADATSPERLPRNQSQFLYLRGE